MGLLPITWVEAAGAKGSARNTETPRRRRTGRRHDAEVARKLSSHLRGPPGALAGAGPSAAPDGATTGGLRQSSRLRGGPAAHKILHPTTGEVRGPDMRRGRTPPKGAASQRPSGQLPVGTLGRFFISSLKSVTWSAGGALICTGLP
ncbi:hypothetical protein GCM10022416_26120 [Actinomadura keratinilytica]|uniref:Uncharacterized protein n=1 Tax=Actinomadura keratinilytica TaxID=547461 RepID=A0ABP7YQA4_9ACTN